LNAQTHFEHLYASAEDPWGYRERWYERRKCSLMLASLPHARYRSAFEPGCSIGITSIELARRCDALLCLDSNAHAVRSAAQGVAAFPHVEVCQASIPQAWPTRAFDLIVLSELLYYLDRHDLDRTLLNMQHSLRNGGTVVACHWLHHVPEARFSVRYIHRAIAKLSGLCSIVCHQEPDFRLDVWSTDARSVAQRENLT
jgi:SAM-dependent methyltransferase